MCFFYYFRAQNLCVGSNMKLCFIMDVYMWNFFILSHFVVFFLFPYHRHHQTRRTRFKQRNGIKRGKGCVVSYLNNGSLSLTLLLINEINASQFSLINSLTEKMLGKKFKKCSHGSSSRGEIRSMKNENEIKKNSCN